MRSRSLISLLIALMLIGTAPVVARAAKAKQPQAITLGKDGKLAYTADVNGDRVPDFSTAGYMGGGVAIPIVPVRVVVPRREGDNTARIQAAIDYVASLPPDDHGIRGAVLLEKGRYEILGGLRISASGVALRGQGMGPEGTVLFAAGQDRRTLITIVGVDDRKLTSSELAIGDKYVPVNATTFHVSGNTGLKTGDTILVRRVCTVEWIKALKMEDIGGGFGAGWKKDTRDVIWDRVVTAVDGDSITIDAPLTTAIDSNFGGGEVASYQWPGRIRQVGVENLRCESACDAANPKDEAHAWIAITIDDAQDAWVRQVTGVHFVSSIVALGDSTKRITVEDCESLAPVSEIAGYRRHSFYTDGGQTLFQRCYAEHGRHDFAVDLCAPGPNAFVQCEAKEALDDSGPIDSWASGVLYDNVRIDGQALSLYDRSFNGQYAGWSAANSVLWQCSASVLNCSSPPTARNWAFGCWGVFSGEANWYDSNSFVKPVSLYYGQLADRLGPEVAQKSNLMPRGTNESTSPSEEEAAELIAESHQPGPQLSQWIDDAPTRTPIPTDVAGARSLDEISPVQSPTTRPVLQTVSITNGWLTIDDKLLTGSKQDIQWWAGGVRPKDVAEARPNITRFVPGRVGRGFTDDLNELTDDMLAGHRAYLDYHYGLWYDTRSADHERTRRINGDVWPPFYELPFARTGGDELAWDGLSKYDLTKYNPWYFSRLKQFANLCDDKGLLLLHENFFQHNILEAGAHWASCPWRSANNINHMGFPEPPLYAGDKRIFMADQFYDVTNSTRREIFRAYIRKCLDNFADNHNVIQLTSAEYSGPLPFMQFWLDTVAEWERETGKKPLIALSAPKDVQDAILADPVRAPLVSVIQIRYWWYMPNGSAYAPPGGKNLSPRQWMRVLKYAYPSFEQAQRAVHEYKEKFPDKVVLLAPEDGPNMPGWAVLMGGGSIPNLPGLDPGLSSAVVAMHPIDLADHPPGQWALGEPDRGYLVYSTSAGSARLDLTSAEGSYAVRFVNPKTEHVSDTSASLSGGSVTDVKGPGGAPWIAWLTKK